MHIAIICDEYPPAPHGGTGSSYRDLAEGLIAAGHRATVLGISVTQALGRATDETINSVRVLRLPRAPRWLGTRLGGCFERRQLRAALRRAHSSTPFDAIECSDYNGWLSGGSGIQAVPTIVRIRGSNLFFDAELARPPQHFEHRHERACLAGATHLASVSRYAAERTLSLAGLGGRPCEIIPNGLDADYFSPDPATAPQPGLVVFVNMVTPRKGIEQLILAVNEIFPSRPHTRLAVVGTDPRGGHLRFVEHLQNLILPELRERVIWTGRLPRDEVLCWLRRAAVCCYPSHMETFGISAIEGMSVGQPVIFTRLGPGPEIVDDGNTGLLCDPRDPADIARCLALLLDDPAFAARLGSAARAEVLRRFDRREWIARNLAFYERCIA